MKYLSLLVASLFISFTTSAQFAEFPNVINFNGLKDTTYILKADSIKGIPEIRYNHGDHYKASYENTWINIENNELGMTLNVGATDSLIFNYDLSNLSVEDDKVNFKFDFRVVNMYNKAKLSLYIRDQNDGSAIFLSENYLNKGSIETDDLSNILKQNGKDFTSNFEIILLSYISRGSAYPTSPLFYFDNFELRKLADTDVRLDEIITPEISSKLSGNNVGVKLINAGKQEISNIPLEIMVMRPSDTLFFQEDAAITIASGDTVDYQINPEINFNEYGQYNLKIKASLENDLYADNDSLSSPYFKIEPQQIGLPFFEDFEDFEYDRFIIPYRTSRYMHQYGFLFSGPSSYFTAAPGYKNRYQLGSSSLNIFLNDSHGFEYHGALDLSNFQASNHQIMFDLRYFVYNNGSEKNKLWVRGNYQDEWLLVNDYSDSTINEVRFSANNISDLFLANNQEFSNTFQFKFTADDGTSSNSFHIDDIAIYDKPAYDIKLNNLTIPPNSSINKSDSNLVEVINRGLNTIQEFTVNLGNVPVDSRSYNPELDTLAYEVTFQKEILSGDTLIVKMPPLLYKEVGPYSVFSDVTTNNDAFSNNNSLQISTFHLGRYEGDLIYSNDFNGENFKNYNGREYLYKGALPNHPGLAVYEDNYDYTIYIDCKDKIRLEPRQGAINEAEKHLLLTLDLEKYSVNSNQINLEFDLLSTEPDSRSDSSKVYARGSEYDDWFVLFDWYENRPSDISWMKLREINLSDSLLAQGQNLSSTTQIRFSNSVHQGKYYQQSLDINNIRVYELLENELGIGEIYADRLDKIVKNDSIKVQIYNEGSQAMNNFELSLQQVFPLDTMSQTRDTIKLSRNYEHTILPKDTVVVWIDSIFYPSAGKYDFELDLSYSGQLYLKNNKKSFSRNQLPKYKAELPQYFQPKDVNDGTYDGSYYGLRSSDFDLFIGNNPGVSFYSYHNGYVQRHGNVFVISGRNLISEDSIYNQNLLLTLDLSSYNDIDGYVGLGFEFDHNEVIYSDSSKVYVRGSEDDPWLMAYDWFSNKPTDGWKKIDKLNISSILKDNGQELGPYTQIRFSLSNYDIDSYFTRNQSLLLRNIVMEEVYQNDVKVLALEEEKSFYLDSEDVKFQFTNLGEDVQVYFPISIQIDGPNGLQTFESSYNGELFKGDTASINITNRFDFSTPGKYNVTLISKLNDDNNRKNDTIQYVLNGVDRYQSTLPYFEDFENAVQDSIQSFAYNISGAKGWSYKAFDIDYPDNEVISFNQEGIALINQDYPERGKVLAFKNTYNSEIKNYLVSKATLTMDLSEYDTTKSNLLLSFDYFYSTFGTWYGAAHVGGFNRLYLRTKRTDDWVEVYDWYDHNNSNDWVSVNEISISEILKQNNLNFTDGMEFRFSQLNFGIEKFLLDNIQLYEDFSGLSGASAFTVNNNNYVVGGEAASGNLNPFTYQYHTESDSFERKILFPGIPRRDAVSFVIDSIAYFGFGSDNDYNSLTDFYKYSEINGWERLNDFPGPARARANSFVIENEAYIGLGSNVNGSLNDLWKYNVDSDSWTQLDDVPFDGRSSAFAAVVNDKAYVGGGVDFVNGSSFQYSDIQEFDPITGLWEEKIYADGINLSVNNATSFALYNKMYIAYGSKDNIIEYNPTTNEITNLGDTLNFGDRRNAPISFITSDSSAFVGLGNYGVFDPVFELGLKEFIIPNELPTVLSLSNNHLDENTTTRVLLGLLSTEDPDQEKNHIYSIVSQEENIQLEIQSDSLFVQGNFNYEEKNHYDFTIKSTDQRNGSIQEDFQLMINDLNEAPTSLNLSDSIVWETLNQVLVGELSAEDPDEGESLRYELLPESNINHNHYFSIQQNELFIDISNDGYQSQLMVELQVIDSEGLSLSISKEITVNERVLELTNNEVSETFDTTFVADINFSNEETTGNISFQLIENDTLDHDKFFIENGELFAKDISIYENDILKIGIRANDEGTLKLDRYFDIEVKDVNFVPVQILLSSEELDVNSEIGTIVGILSTIDPDSTDSHTYEVIDNDYFTVNTNELVTARVFESLESVEIIIRSSDQNGEFIDQSFLIELTGEIEGVLSNAKHLSKSIKLFPNPSDGLIYIKSSIPILEMQLFDATGKLIRHYNYEEVIVLYDLESGVYHLQIRTEDGIVVKQILLMD